MSDLNQYTIQPYQEISSSKVHDAIREIFFLSTSRKHFADLDEREAFFTRWTSAYTSTWPDCIWVATKNLGICAYLMGCPDSLKLISRYQVELPSYLVFQDQFRRFPAHLHMNTHPEHRSRGLGKLLLSSFLEQLKERSCSGVHIVTSPLELNREFYKSNLFDIEIERRYKDFDLLFMGRKLDDQRSSAGFEIKK